MYRVSGLVEDKWVRDIMDFAALRDVSHVDDTVLPKEHVASESLGHDWERKDFLFPWQKIFFHGGQEAFGKAMGMASHGQSQQ